MRNFTAANGIILPNFGFGFRDSYFNFMCLGINFEKVWLHLTFMKWHKKSSHFFVSLLCIFTIYQWRNVFLMIFDIIKLKYLCKFRKNFSAGNSLTILFFNLMIRKIYFTLKYCSSINKMVSKVSRRHFINWLKLWGLCLVVGYNKILGFWVVIFLLLFVERK